MLKIDVEAAVGFERAATGLHSSLTTVAEQARQALAAGGLSDRAASLIEQIAGHVQGTGQGFGDASRRASAADVFTFSAPGLSPSKAPTGPSGSSDAEAIEKAEEYAKWLLGNNQNGDLEAAVNKTEEIAAFLEEHANDPEVLQAFFEALGPNGVLKVPELLSRLDQGSGEYYIPPDYVLVNEDGTPKTQQAQHNLMVALGDALANASTSGALDPSFDDELTDIVVQNPLRGWALSEVLRNGTYAEDFLVTIGDGLYELERGADEDRFWYNRATLYGGRDVPRLGLDRDDQYYDPFVGLFEAMGRTPDAALKFLYPTVKQARGGTLVVTSDRAKYFIQDRTWSHDDFNAIGEFLDAAATAHRGPITSSTTAEERQHMALSSMAASHTVKFLAARNVPIGAAGADSIGHLLANYIAEIDYLAGDHANTPASWAGQPNVALYAGYPPIAQMEFDDVQKLLTQVLPNDSALEQVTQATNALAQARLNVAVNADRNRREEIETAIAKNGLLGGFIVGAAGLGSEKLAGEQLARQKAVLDLIGSGLTSVPVPGGAFVGFVVNQAVDKGKDWVTDGLGDGVTEAKDENFEYKTELKNRLKLKVGVALGEAGLLDEQTRTDGTTYDWFVDGKFDPSIAKANQDEFLEYLASADSGWNNEVGETDDKVSNGVDRGKKDD